MGEPAETRPMTGSPVSSNKRIPRDEPQQFDRPLAASALRCSSAHWRPETERLGDFRTGRRRTTLGDRVRMSSRSQLGAGQIGHARTCVSIQYLALYTVIERMQVRPLNPLRNPKKTAAKGRRDFLQQLFIQRDVVQQPPNPLDLSRITSRGRNWNG